MNAADHHPRSDTRHQSLYVQQDEHYSNEQPNRRRRISPTPQGRSARFAGDGLDFRRPVMSRPQSQYIDLTREDTLGPTNSIGDGTHESRSTLALPAVPAQRLPRYERNIISIGSDDEQEQDGGVGSSAHTQPVRRREWSQDRRQYSALRQSPHSGTNSEEGSVRNRAHHVEPDYVSSLHGTRGTAPQPSNLDNPVIDLTNDNEDDMATNDDDDVVVTNTRRVGGINLSHPEPGVRDLHDYGMATIVPRLYERLRGMRATEGQNRQPVPRLPYIADYMRRNGVAVPRVPEPPAPGVRVMIDGYNALREMMFDYQRPAFDLGMDGGNRPASPKYEPPKDAAPGFTRTPGEDEVVVCPNCGDELATGSDEMKQELWVIRACGHVSFPRAVGGNASVQMLIFQTLGILRNLRAERVQSIEVLQVSRQRQRQGYERHGRTTSSKTMCRECVRLKSLED
jgi:hypothetical protein